MGKVANYFGGLVLKNGDLIHEDIWVRNGKIINPADVNYTADISIECFNTIITPGFLDLKCNGAYGVDFQSVQGLKGGLRQVCRDILKSGVTNFCPSLITKDAKFYHEAIPLISKKAADPLTGAGIMGVHLDGPFISVVGAHPAEFVKSSVESVNSVTEVYGQDLEQVAILSLAPELPGVLNVIPDLKRWGITITIGHSKADLQTGEAAVKQGASMISHLFNAMPNFHHRDPSIVGLMTSDHVKNVKYTLISDGHHVHPAALRMAYRMAPQGMILITDGQAPLGLGLGSFKVSTTDVEVVDKGNSGKPVCILKDSDTLYGSVCPMNDAVRNLVEIADCTRAFALECATRRPAEVMGLYPQKGSLEWGADADFAILKPETMEVHATFIAGQKVFDSGSMSTLQLAPSSPLWISDSQNQEPSN
eukprot:Gregarina_sp_Poly_1__2836@NODE_1790_length_3326_cov_370_843510_g1166_i0_p1_GENE_NODE_1790_length_3326_cov_370_843510_g1166_i0NODE_1790_length_3326_cov_370_843510_g1166_i0_p1_ORF_typecomplete_len421_score48_62Amidohydro_1/PF01979_20/5_1e29Amidohydro_3/PF07969_11/3e03Amidohydro_3/PF07969_11/1_3e08_NODE_1790_length_3326_cov_370_843510_g1166_i020143276